MSTAFRLLLATLGSSFLGCSGNGLLGSMYICSGLPVMFNASFGSTEYLVGVVM